MAFDAAWQRKTLRVLIPAILALLILCFPSLSSAQQQPAAKRATLNPTPKSSSPLLSEAETLLREGRTADAKRKIQDELQLHPANAEAYDLLGVISVNEKDYANALEAFQHALKLDPGSLRTRNSIANVYVAQGHLALAEQEFRIVLRAAPANRDANYNLGLVLLAQGFPAKAIPYFQRVRPPNLESKFNLTHAYLQAGKTAQGLDSAKALSAEYQDNIQLHFTLGVLLASEKQYRPAQLELEKANALQPETFEILYNLGQAYLRAADYPQAELTLNRALALKPDSPDALYQLAQVFTDQRKPVDALELLVRAHKLAPQNTDVIFLLARVSMTQNYFEDAIPLLESGIQIAPQRADLRAALGESYFMSGKTEKAIDAFKQLIALQPSAGSYAFMGLSYRHLGRFDEAKQYFQAGLKLDPRNASCLFNMGFIEERQGNHSAAETYFQQALQSNPGYSEALLELANLRMANKKFQDAADLLRRYVRVSRDPASGYYKLAMVERSLHQTEAAQRDLNVFQTLSKNTSTGPYPYQHLFDYLDNRAALSSRERAQLDVTQLTEQIQKHPDQPQDLYLLSETYLKLGKVDDARKAIAQLDRLSANDYRTQTGIGVLFARYRLYDDAIPHFQSALRANPDSDDVKFDLADAFFRKSLYSQALEVSSQVSLAGQQDDAYLALLGDIQAHLGDTARATEIYRDAIRRNPDNDQYYLSLTLLQLRSGDIRGASDTLQQGLARIPGSGKILWGLGLISVLQGNTPQAAQRLERAVELLPEWAGSYSTLGVFYYQTGQIEKAREVLDRFKGSNAGGLDVSRIEQALSRAPTQTASATAPLPLPARQQLLQLALSLAERTL
ncbi:MAG TPA: tetratricopeptide repeat protein [Candidatus Acidoferrum sp.]|nr:tetratricopeptide repeat protein [Candidatus Acidoferrum sp.]